MILMPDREKVIKGLERLLGTAGCIAIYDSECKSCPYSHVNGCVDQILKDALELLKAQEPAKPIVAGKETHWYECECGTGIDYRDPFCRGCGRLVKWE